MIRIISVSFILMFFLVKLGKAQPQPKYIPPTPLAAQYEKYINYPVDHSTGAASVDVPLYVINGAGIKLPISLSYHTAGVKPGDPSLPVGLGWTINPGARVSRSVNGYADETYPKPPYQEGISPVDDLLYLENMEYDNPVSSNRTTTYDPDYDIFTYNTGTGASGRFIIQNEGGQFVVHPLVVTKDKINIHVVGSGNTTGIDYVEITDANGVYYRFGVGLNSYSNASSSSRIENLLAGTGVTGWMLTDIVSADKADTISLTWKNVQNSAGNYYKQYSVNDVMVLTDMRNILGGSWPGPETYPEIGYSPVPVITQMPQTESFYLMNIISGIRYKNEDVNFIYSSGVPTFLNSMEVYSGNNKIRQVDFHKSLFPGDHVKLDSVSIIDKLNQVVGRYRFGYNIPNEYPSDGRTRSIDYWGYYNSHNNQVLVPSLPYTLTGYGEGPDLTEAFTTTNRTSNMNAAANILNSVIYPTGGKTTFEYELNQILNPLNQQVVTMGGLRVKKIEHWSANGQLAETRTYKYGINESGNGDGVPITADMFVNTTQILWYHNMQYRKRVVSSSPLGQIFRFESPTVTYQAVSEYIGDASGSNTGKIVYRYTAAGYPTHQYGYSHDLFAYMDRYWDRPRPISTTYYNNVQGFFKPVKENITTYHRVETDTIYCWTVRRYAYFEVTPAAPAAHLIEASFNTYYPNLGSVFGFNNIYLYSGLIAPAEEKEIQYTPTGEAIVTAKTYNYANNDYLYPESITTTSSDGTITTIHFKYPKDYNVGTSPTNTVAQGIKLLKDRNVVAPVIEEYTEVQPGNVIKSGSFTTYKTDKPVPENLFSLNTIPSAGTFSPATITSSAHTKSSAYLLKSTFDLYDQFGNLRQVTDDKGISTVILYSYGGKLPIAVIKNATYASVTGVKSDALINDFAPGYPTDTEVNNFLSSLRSSLPLAFISTYTHDPAFGMTSQTDENGRATYYVYDAAGRLELIKDKDGNVVKTFEYKYRQ